MYIFIKRLWILLVISSAIQCRTENQGQDHTYKKKNLLFIMTDQQRSDAMSLAGNQVLQTPNLDKLGNEGAYFINAYTPCAVCAPARSSILTGHTVEHTGMRTNDRAYYYEEEGLMTMPTFDEILTENGYHCEYYGKWHSQTSHTDIYKNPKQQAKNGKSIFAHGGQNHVYVDYINEHFPKRELRDGEMYDKFTKRPYIPDPMDKYYGHLYEEVDEERKKLSQPNFYGELQVPAEHSFTAFQAKETIAAIERLKDSTFSITCSFHFPHAPMIPPKPYYGMYPASEMKAPVSIHDDMINSPYQKANGRIGLPEYTDSARVKYMISNYYGLVREIDDWVGKMMSKLDELCLAENTLVIYTSDHGEMLGAHGMREKNVFYEESAHIPLLIRLPGEIESQTRVNGYVSLVDLFPTILDYLDVAAKPSDGKSLKGLMQGTDQKHGEYVVTEWNYRGDISPNYMIVKDGWKLLIPYSKESDVLNAMYNLNSDPYEMNNLLGNNPMSTQYASKAEELRNALLEWLNKNGSIYFDGVKARRLI